MAKLSLESPFGDLTLTEQDGAITRLEWKGDGRDRTPLLEAAARQLTEYFDGDRTMFDLPLSPRVSETQRRFCAALTDIPFGEVRTYGEMAAATGLSAQAAGQACGANPIPILIPCHRVVGTGHLGGFSAPGGIETKVALLRHEGAAGLLI